MPEERRGPVTNQHLHDLLMEQDKRSELYQRNNDRRIEMIETEVRPLRGLEDRLHMHIAENLKPLNALLAETQENRKRQERIWKGVLTLLSATGATIVGALAHHFGWL
jgi:hypothetical protein